MLRAQKNRSRAAVASACEFPGGQSQVAGLTATGGTLAGEADWRQLGGHARLGGVTGPARHGV